MPWWWNIIRKVFIEILTRDRRPSTPESPEFWVKVLPVGDTTWSPPTTNYRPRFLCIRPYIVPVPGRVLQTKTPTAAKVLIGPRNFRSVTRRSPLPALILPAKTKMVGMMETKMKV